MLWCWARHNAIQTQPQQFQSSTTTTQHAHKNQKQITKNAAVVLLLLMLLLRSSVKMMVMDWVSASAALGRAQVPGHVALLRACNGATRKQTPMLAAAVQHLSSSAAPQPRLAAAAAARCQAQYCASSCMPNSSTLCTWPPANRHSARHLSTVTQQPHQRSPSSAVACEASAAQQQPSVSMTYDTTPTPRRPLARKLPVDMNAEERLQVGARRPGGVHAVAGVLTLSLQAPLAADAVLLLLLLWCVCVHTVSLPPALMHVAHCLPAACLLPVCTVSSTRARPNNPANTTLHCRSACVRRQSVSWAGTQAGWCWWETSTLPGASALSAATGRMGRTALRSLSKQTSLARQSC